jgi:prepilin peptidase CpaA
MIQHDLALLAVFPAMMAVAALYDVATLKIPNHLVMGLVLAFFTIAVALGHGAQMIASNMAAGTAMLLVTIMLFARGWIGGGDAKLLAAAALWLGPGLLFALFVTTAIFGGVLGLVVLCYRALPLAMAVPEWAARLHHRNAGIPYGVAIAAAGIFIYSRSFWMNGY